VTVRISARLGSVRMPLGRAVALDGAIVELDRDADEPVEILADGRLFAIGRLVVGDDGRWAVRIERILG
jgi:flagellar motor switch/type III secretory pathway protein FliN